MASPKQPQSPGLTSFDDLFAVDTSCDDGNAIRTESIPTGLSEEDDAARLLAIHFNSRFCIHCETYNGPECGRFCPTCFFELRPVGTHPVHRKRKYRRG